jgi:hypothetical protein
VKNPFKEILEDEKLPEIIRTRVMNDVDLIRLSLDLSDLFLVKNPDILKTLFKNENDEKKP